MDEGMRLIQRYRRYHVGWNIKHFYAWYRRNGGRRSYTWVKSRLQQARLVKKDKGRGKHRKRLMPAPWPGMMLHQDGSTHQWVPQVYWDQCGGPQKLDNVLSSGSHPKRSFS